MPEGVQSGIADHSERKSIEELASERLPPDLYQETFRLELIEGKIRAERERTARSVAFTIVGILSAAVIVRLGSPMIMADMARVELVMEAARDVTVGLSPLLGAVVGFYFAESRLAK